MEESLINFSFPPYIFISIKILFPYYRKLGKFQKSLKFKKIFHHSIKPELILTVSHPIKIRPVAAHRPPGVIAWHWHQYSSAWRSILESVEQKIHRDPERPCFLSGFRFLHMGKLTEAVSVSDVLGVTTFQFHRHVTSLTKWMPASLGEIGGLGELDAG